MKNENTEDTELAAKMKLGDRSAFNVLYEKYSTRIIRSAYLLTGDYQLSEDIMQETFVKCFLHCRELKDNSRFEVWLMQIMHRTAWKLISKRKAEVPEEEIENQTEKSEENDCFSSALRDEQSTRINAAMAKMCGKYREVLILYYYDELSVREIARATGCFEGTVKSRLYKARTLIRSQLQSHEEKEVTFHAGSENIG